MKIILCLFLFHVYFCLGDNEYASNIGDVHYGHHQHGLLERPCSLQDLSCIRRYLGLSSHCSVHGPTQDRHRINKVSMITPNINVSSTMYDIDIDGFNDYKIMEFYVNKETNRLVLEVQFRKLRLHSPRLVLTFHRKGMEPLVRADDLSIAYRDISFTLTAPLVEDVKGSKSHVYTFIADPAPNMKLGPQLSQSKDSQVRRVMSQVTNQLGLQLQEAFVTLGPILMSTFLQNNICRQ